MQRTDDEAERVSPLSKPPPNKLPVAAEITGEKNWVAYAPFHKPL